MPRKPDPSFDLKLIIWDIAATNGTENYSVIYRELNRKLEELRTKGRFFETTPDQRKVKDIIELDIQRLKPEVVMAKLPSHVWHLRNDYEIIKQLAEINKSEQDKANKTEKSSILDRRIMKHFDELAETAKILVHQAQRLLSYPDNDNIQVSGDLFGGLMFWLKHNMTIVEEIDRPAAGLEYEREHPLNPYLAGLLYIHNSEKFGKLPSAEWNKISTDSVNSQIVKNLNLLAHGGLEPCVQCSVCKIWKDKWA